MSKIDIDKFVCSLIEFTMTRGSVFYTFYEEALNKMGLKYENGEIVEVESKIKESKFKVGDIIERNYSPIMGVVEKVYDTYCVCRINEHWLETIPRSEEDDWTYIAKSATAVQESISFISDQVKATNAIDIITDIDVDKMVERKFQSIDGAYNCKEWYLRGIEDALEEIKKISK